MTVNTMIEKLNDNKANNRPYPEVISVLIGNNCYDYKNYEKLGRQFGDRKIKGMHADSNTELTIAL